MKYKNVFLSVGTNLGNKIENIITSIIKISQIDNTRIIKISSLYETFPVGNALQPNFYNIGIYLQTKLNPYKFLEEINKIENDLHRERIEFWGSRTIDIDIILYENMNINTEKLTIPHKEYKKRNFVLEPLYEIFPFIRRMKKNLKYGITRKIKPNINIGISACIVGINTKYNGGNNYKNIFKEMYKIVNLIPLCPEQLSGLSTPRNSVEIDNNRVIDVYKNDYTNKFMIGAYESYKILKLLKCEIVILKSNSPSCGYKGVYNGSFNNTLILGNGISVDYYLKKNIKIIKY
ncbi:MAG: 2-amino-4-hydroxy-6-hydroxymethyldihydropteridine diphosphokinase [Fusobacteria bacterium]|nr:2-amino-4-hydroxy-6-hydroxymethyldihydropteridine diphosphokinase [Fusobacteriota bacterium]